LRRPPRRGRCGGASLSCHPPWPRRARTRGFGRHAALRPISAGVGAAACHPGKRRGSPALLYRAPPAASLSSMVATASRSPSTSRPTEIRALTGARFLPVLFIVVFHYHEWYGYTGRYWIDLFVVKGYLWVEFFFSLSGFILYYVYGRRLAVR